MADLPAAPINVCVVFDNGDRVPVECAYQGFVDGLHQWMATAIVRVDADVERSWIGVQAETVPPDTKISVRFAQ